MTMHVAIPLRDGTKLEAVIYRPYPSTGPIPVIFSLTPYPEWSAYPSGAYFAQHGYVFANVQVRGRGDSGGQFDPFVNEGRDGYDVVEWLARQPWSNGKVAMFGGSYVGGDQWLTAAEKPPHLAAIAPVASAHAGTDFPAQNHILIQYDLQWLAVTSGRILYSDVYRQDKLFGDASLRLFNDKAPFRDADLYDLGYENTLFRTYLAHPDADAYWKARAGDPEKIADIRIPVLEITGARDGDEVGQLSYHQDLLRRGGNTSDSLVIGPWSHETTRQTQADIEGVHYGPASVVDVLKLHLEWYDNVLKGGPVPAFLARPVAYYVAGAGAECWKSADTLNAVAVAHQSYFLSAGQGAAFGGLQPMLAGAVGGGWISDPNDLDYVKDEDRPNGATLHGSGLVFDTQPFDHATEIDGRMDLSLWLSIDAPDTDLRANLYLVLPDGGVRDLNETVLRARYRKSAEHPEAIRQNQPEAYHFAPGQWFAIRAPVGAKLRLIVGSLNDPFYEKNWNVMKPVAEQSGRDARIAHVHLLQSTDHPSTLTLPIGDINGPCNASVGL